MQKAGPADTVRYSSQQFMQANVTPSAHMQSALHIEGTADVPVHTLVPNPNPHLDTVPLLFSRDTDQVRCAYPNVVIPPYQPTSPEKYE